MSSVAKSSGSINEYHFFFTLRNQRCTENARKAAAKYISPRWLHPKLTRSLVWIWRIYASPLESNLVMLRQSRFNSASIRVSWCTTPRIRALNLEGFKNTSSLDLELVCVFDVEFRKQQFVLHEEDETCLFLKTAAHAHALFLPKYKCKAIKIAVLNLNLWLLCEI